MKYFALELFAFAVLVIAALAVGIIVEVSKLEDSPGDFSLCDNVALGDCNLRSALAYCAHQQLDLGETERCTVQLPADGKNNLLAQYGPIFINGTDIAVQGSIRTVIAPTNTLFGPAFLFLRTDSSYDNFTLSDMQIEGFQSENGGAVSIIGPGTVRLSKIAFLSNTATVGGGSVYVADNMDGVVIEDCTFDSSVAAAGGAIFLDQNVHYATIVRCHFDTCSASDSGGSIAIGSGNDNVVIEDTVIVNSSAKDGGGIHVGDNNYNGLLVDVAVTDGFAELQGGGIFIGTRNAAIQLRGVKLANCKAIYGGGLFSASNDYMTLEDTTVTDCGGHPGYLTQGGGLYLGSNNHFLMRNSELRGCRATSGGGLMLRTRNQDVTFINSTFADCSATSGGAIYSGLGTIALQIGSCVFERNAATSDGGAVYVEMGNDQLLLADQRTVLGAQVVETAHPYHPWSFSRTIYVPGAVGYWLYFDQSTSIGGRDWITLSTPTASEYRVFYGNDGSQINDLPGIRQPAIRVDAEEFTLALYSPIVEAQNLWGLRAYVIPILPPESVVPNVFKDNRAEEGGGGAICITSAVRYAMLLHSHFVGNSAGGIGGAIDLRASMIAMTMQYLAFRDNSAVKRHGGAVCASALAHGWEVLDSEFSGNSAPQGGGGAVAFLVDNGISGTLSSQFNSISFHGCDFRGNTALQGGGLYLLEVNRVKLSQCTLTSNTASQAGGAIYMDRNNQLEMETCAIADNHAVGKGGAVAMLGTGNYWLAAGTVLSGNHAGSWGGALCAEQTSILLSYGTKFSSNTAAFGGAMYVTTGTIIMIAAGTTLFNNNTAGVAGGAVAFVDAPMWMGLFGAVDVVLVGNTAPRGSAVYVHAKTAPKTALALELTLAASTGWRTDPQGLGNHHRRLQFGPPQPRATVTDNVASIGGTVFWICDSVPDCAPPEVFNEATTLWGNNPAPYGSQYATQAVRINASLPTMMATYGSPLSPAPALTLRDYHDQVVAVKVGVELSVSLRNPNADQCGGRYPFLAGFTTLQGTGKQFALDNLRVHCAPNGVVELEYRIAQSDLLLESGNQGPIAYDIATVSQMRFRNCSRGEYISGGECVTCANGTYSLEYPVTEATKCLECGGKRGVESCEADMLKLKAGYWRRHDTSYAVLECIGSISGCAGGYATGAAACEVGYEGPLCGVCADGYFSEDGVCESCSSSPFEDSTTTVAFLAVAVVVLGLLAFVFYAKCIDGGSEAGDDAVGGGESSRQNNGRSEVDDIEGGEPGEQGDDVESPGHSPVCCSRSWIQKEFNRMQAQLKIVITTYQIVSAIPENMDVTFPSSFNSVLNVFSVFNLNVMNSVPFTCSDRYTYIDTLVFKTLFPIGLSIVLCLVAAADVAWQTRNLRLSDSARVPIVIAVRDQYLTYFFFLTYLVLPSVATTIFQTFLCTNVDPRGEDSDKYDSYLIADMSISCTSRYYYKGVGYAVAMLFVYVVGIPLMYLLMLYYNREEIAHRDDVVELPAVECEGRDGGSESEQKPAATKGVSLAAQRLSFLWEAYEPQFWYWEVVETTRRLILTAVLSVCGAGSSAQSVLAVLLGVLYIKLYGFYAPYVSDDDDVVAEVGQFQIFFSFLGALIYQNELLGSDWNGAVGAVLIVINGAVTLLFTYYGCRSLKDQVKDAKELLEEGPVQATELKDGGSEEILPEEGCGDSAAVLKPLWDLWPAPTPRAANDDAAADGGDAVGLSDRCELDGSTGNTVGEIPVPPGPAPSDRLEEVAHRTVVVNDI